LLFAFFCLERLYGITKRAGCNHCARAATLITELVPEAQFLDDLPVSVDIRTLQVVQETATTSDHLEEPTTTVVVLFVEAEVVRQIVDLLGEQGDLNAGRASVGLVCPIFLDGRTFFESHVLVILSRVGGVRCSHYVIAVNRSGLLR
jgi:hypothetical protein